MVQRVENDQSLCRVTSEKIAEALRRIVETAHPVCVILFGSQARGDASPDSDVDVLVVEREVANRYSEMVRLNRSLRGLLLPVDLLVIDERSYDEWSDTPGSVYHAARQEGKVLYAAT